MLVFLAAPINALSIKLNIFCIFQEFIPVCFFKHSPHFVMVSIGEIILLNFWNAIVLEFFMFTTGIGNIKSDHLVI